MTLERSWLLGTARAERDALGRSIQYTPPKTWDAESASAGWRNRDIVAHLAADEVLAAAILAGEPAAELEEYVKSLDGEPFQIDSFNEWTVQRRAAEPFRAVVTEWGRAADLFLARAAKIEPGEWTSRRVHWVAGEIGVSYLIQSRVMEWWLHGEDIRLGADLEPRIEHPPIFCVNDLAVRMIPYA
ncbi:MAG: maleylpyruvate isomerase family mycothiol-dependent enzyme, partial [Actinomycetota bacterium]